MKNSNYNYGVTIISLIIADRKFGSSIFIILFNEIFLKSYLLFY